MKAAAVVLSPEMFHTLLQLPDTSEVVDMFFDPWTKGLVLVCKDDQFPEKQEGEQYARAQPIYERDVKNLGTDKDLIVGPWRFVKYAVDGQ